MFGRRTSTQASPAQSQLTDYRDKYIAILLQPLFCGSNRGGTHPKHEWQPILSKPTIKHAADLEPNDQYFAWENDTWRLDYDRMCKCWMCGTLGRHAAAFWAIFFIVDSRKKTSVGVSQGSQAGRRRTIFCAKSVTYEYKSMMRCSHKLKLSDRHDRNSPHPSPSRCTESPKTTW